MYLFPNGRYIDCLLQIYATNKGEILKLRYKYYIKKRKNIKEQEKIRSKYWSSNDKQ
jgi:hypothetical protein